VTSSEVVIVGGERVAMIEAPKLRQLLTDSAKTAEERIAGALECLRVDGDGALLTQGNGAVEPAGGAAARGPEEKAQKTPPKIDWDAPSKECVTDLARLMGREPEGEG
jgi:hypothetical protein